MNWEYLIKKDTSHLNFVGGQGWEICGCLKHEIIFKRPMKCINCYYHITENGIAKCEYNEENISEGSGCKYFKKQ